MLVNYLCKTNLLKSALSMKSKAIKIPYLLI